MKKTLILIALAGIFLSACSSSNEEEPDMILVDKFVYIFPPHREYKVHVGDSMTFTSLVPFFVITMDNGQNGKDSTILLPSPSLRKEFSPQECNFHWLHMTHPNDSIITVKVTDVPDDTVHFISIVTDCFEDEYPGYFAACNSLEFYLLKP